MGDAMTQAPPDSRSIGFLPNGAMILDVLTSASGLLIIKTSVGTYISENNKPLRLQEPGKPR